MLVHPQHFEGQRRGARVEALRVAAVVPLVADDAEFVVRVEGDAEPRRWFLPGSPPSPAALRAWFNKACDAAGVGELTPHDYRHFYASGLVRAGLDAVSVARAMGHASATITLSVYAHLFPGAADRTRSAASDLLDSTESSADEVRTSADER
ncbi:tyrosine-type recombinase/integrase [Curtobacterium sp. JUb34]|uniref:tyrosine-type recombinase/integrase n=1 Tax=Curtobacterium sp. JUb34 TaxID=2485109 RepID=UPI000F4A603D